MDGLFIFTLGSDPQFFVIVVLTVVSSIVLHELAHGVAALRLGDPTPRLRGHMTLNPMVHMGPVSLLVLAVAGIAWGAMPVDPTRLRGRYAESLVALAGPATNLVLAFGSLTLLGVIYATAADSLDDGVVWRNAERLLRVFGNLNLVLCLFNLLPVPPLDGSRVVANFSAGYRAFVTNPSNSGVLLLLFPLAFLFGGRLFDVAREVTTAYLSLFLPAGFTLS